MMKAIYLLLHMLGAGVSGYTFFRLCQVVDNFNPTSIQRRKQVWVLLITVGVICIVNLFFWVPDYYAKTFEDVIEGVVVGFRLIITLGVSYYLLRDYIPDFKQKYSLNFVVYKNPENPMSQVGELVSFAACEAMMERYRTSHPGCKENFFFSTDFVRQIIGTDGAKFLMMAPGETEEGEETMILWPGDENTNRIPMKKPSDLTRRGDGDDDGDYGADRSGTTPPGKG